ncbi:MAG: ribonuclease BN [Candidatus Harrisonbacteria bacterium CG10_big_fil_rev_8_21_14_0_10_45_28]|uniref:Ribonuclease BN n=1 Tax=Candidatus Harrisonbacteria bacterium CG10_big_fil_rev_8_21_14_0_10_45_28 TaxID=1974586 RepID=A0A2H0UQ16_9BACT|nr:MAG: ribonuclease BN [Candidatus Harrisonbacteria bacterium CG10_big_fil_rev_8_21_14_0_10_45_28]
MKNKKDSILKITFSNWQKDNASRIGAALAYYAVFSLAPLLLILIGVSRIFFVQDAARENLLVQLEKIISPAGRQVAETILSNATTLTIKGGTTATVIGVVIVLIGAMAVFRQIYNALDTIWRTSISRRHGHIKAFLIKNLISLVMIIAAGVLLVSSFIISAIISGIASNPTIHFPAVFWESINTIISFLVITLVFAITVKMLSAVKLKWAHIWLGALTTSFFFILGKFGFGLYLMLTNLGSAYGAAGALIIFLFWVFYSAQIFLFGVELVKAKSQA